MTPPMDEPQETIEKAAIRFEGTVYTVPRPGRHHNVIREMARQGFGPEAMHDQGFVTNTARFVNRREACRIATEADQIIKKTGGDDDLFSEDVW